MVRHQLLPTRIIVPVAGAILVGAFTSVPVHASDDPVLRPIIQAIERDRKNACPNSGILSGDNKLEAIAQDYARSENPAKVLPPPGYNRVIPVLGSGDPQAQAINSAYKRGASPVISTCNEFAFGVGFVRHEDRKVDVVTIIFGELTPPRHPATVRLNLIPHVGFHISGSGFSQNSTVTINFHYDNGNGGNTNGDSPPRTNPVDSNGNFVTDVKVSTVINNQGTLDVDAEDTGGLSTTKSVQF